MKRKIIIIYLFVLIIFPVNELHSQTTQEPSPALKSGPQLSTSISEQPATGPGQPIYFTHPEFPNIITRTVTIPAQNTEEGYLFLGVPAAYNNDDSILMIVDDTAEPVYIAITDDQFVGNLRKQTANGVDYLTYHGGYIPGGYTIGTNYVLDTGYELVDTWSSINGQGTDIHEFLLLDNGHVILMAYVPIPYDLTPYGGPADGTLLEIVLQEQDANKNVVFEWIGSEHMPIGDTEVDPSPTGRLDFLHTNGIEVDDDGNWLLSHRNFSEITKINRQTGQVMWRMGGAGNEFTFTNDIGFAKQHNIIRLENGNITIFDNGNDHNPPHSRAVEYAIDEVAKTVTRVWMYPDDTSEYSVAMGNFQRLPLGNGLIGWGTQPKLTEVLNDGTVALEMLLGGPTYRAFRYPWNATPAENPRAAVQYDTDPTAVDLYTSWNGATDIIAYDVYAGPTNTSLVFLGNVPSGGFETAISLTGLPPDTCFFRTKPIHAQGNPTPFSNIIYRLDLPVCWAQLSHPYMPVIRK